MDPPISPTAQNPPDAQIDHAASLTYWNSVSADTTGMLGGFPQTSRIDLQGSSNFLAKLRRAARPSPSGTAGASLPRLNRVADCGAGVGRVTNGFLRNVADTVDVVEPVVKFTDAIARDGDNNNTHDSSRKEEDTPRGRIGEIINLGLQDWHPSPNTYDLIWNQWCLGHLTDAQLVEYLVRCKAGLVQGSSATPAWIVVKENMSTDAWKRDIYDEVDSSVTRSDEKFRDLFKKAGLKVVAADLQRGFPRDLFPVRMYALRPE
ncbi:hypothetical protein DM02DRAFT_517585 [Periconia macrospinosa]|uniref:Alpha N-terminal protein methyltransferase 1 n=1 Tax=Periconia macrospinosa TaxID=97972 RepID=A0A2V1E3G7_9PLEO|nr:hypothetical protein DM02DRAFT_517585 [Periconia macrospinosa]